MGRRISGNETLISLHSTHHFTQHITSLSTSLHSTHHFIQHITSLNTSLHLTHHFTQHNIVIFYYPLKTQQYQSAICQYYFISLATCFGCKQPSSGQNRTKCRYIEGVHCMGSHIVYRGADKSLAIPERKQATATEVLMFIYPIYYSNWSIINTIYK